MSQVGYYLISSFQRSALKESMQEDLSSGNSDNKIQTIVLEENTTTIRWEEDGKEFYLDGKLYDVASIEKQGGRTLVHCVCDKDETQLATNVAKAVSSANDKANGKESKHIVKFQSPDFTFLPIGKTDLSITTGATRYFDFDSAIDPSFSDVEITPPRA